MERSLGVFFYLKKQKNYESDETPIYMRITVNGNRIEVSVREKCDPSNWNADAGRMNGKTDKAKSLNQLLDILQRKVYDARKQLLDNDQPVSAENIKIMLTGREINKEEHLLIEFFKKHNKQMKALVGREFAAGTHERYTTSADYLKHKTELVNKKHITVVGSGQSAAEIFYDLLKTRPVDGYHLDWVTRSSGFYQMETSKLVCEFTSPDYIDYFYRLPKEVKTKLLQQQDHLYKGINRELIEAIYRELYARSLEENESIIRLLTSMQLTSVAEISQQRLQLDWYHREQQLPMQTETDRVILATGYQSKLPTFLNTVKKRINWASDGHYIVNRNYTIDQHAKEIFVQNAELCSHGFSAPDLGLGPYRNMMIINTILGDDFFSVQKENVFQMFGRF